MARLSLPPLNAVRAFEAAARRGSFVEAAADLNVTHWAIGKQIRLLEDWLGVPLFERRSSGIALIEGAELSSDVSALLSRLSEATAKLRRPEVTRRVSGLVRVNVQPSFALRWLFPRLARFQELFPNIEVRVSTTSRKLRYIGSAFDIGVRSAPEKSAGLRSEVLMPDRRLPACSPELLRKRPVQTVDDLRHHVRLHSATTRSAWSQWLAAAGAADLKAVRQLELEHVYLQLQAAGPRCGAGVGAFDRGGCRCGPPGVPDSGPAVARWRLRARDQRRAHRDSGRSRFPGLDQNNGPRCNAARLKVNQDDTRCARLFSGTKLTFAALWVIAPSFS
jgi:LysR family transcriptional regulator, glycine cleavage system transcriptional activator